MRGESDMSMASNFVLIVGIAVAASAIAYTVALKIRRNNEDGVQKFKSKPLLTPNELEFLQRLEAAVPELRFCPQVAMGALLQPAVERRDRSAYYSQRGRFAQKIVDYVAQQRDDGAVVAVIELDDRTHNRAKDAERDAMLASAGYRIIRWQSRAKPDAAAIREALVKPSHALADSDPRRDGQHRQHVPARPSWGHSERTSDTREPATATAPPSPRNSATS